MPKQNLQDDTAPAAVADVVQQIGRNIAQARLRRNLTLEGLATKAGLSKETASRVEAGRITTSIGAYAAALWALGIHDDLANVGDPDSDVEGKILAAANTRRRARRKRRLSDDF